MAAGFSGGAKLEEVLRNTVKKLSEGKTLRVGFLEDENYPDGTPVAQVAFWNEYGTKTSPPRPFFRQTIAAKSGKWGAALGKALVANGNNVDAAMSLVGIGIKDQITQSVVAFADPENAASTIEHKGFNKPLVDTGQMQRSVGFDIEGAE